MFHEQIRSCTSKCDIRQSSMRRDFSYKVVIPTGLSDHDLIACVRKVNVKYESETIRYRDNNNYDVNVINN